MTGNYMMIRLPEGELTRLTHEQPIYGEPLEAVGTWEIAEPSYYLDGQEITRERAVELLEAERARQGRDDLRPAGEWL
jgi:hypothetical protein